MGDSLAIDGGVPIRTEPYPQWPCWDKREEQALLDTLHSGNWWRVPGTEAKAFEAEFAAAHGAKHGIAVTSGSAALEVCLRAADLRWGDEVITSPYTFVATVHSCLLVGVVPRFADIEPGTWNLDPEKIEELINERTRAILAVHIGGEPANMDAMRRVAAEHDLLLIEDAAQAHGAGWRGERVGALGDMGTFSFQSSKNMTGGEGGVVLTQDDDWAARCRSVMNVGRSPGGHWGCHVGLASNYRLAEWSAAVLRVQLKRLDEQMALRSRNARYLGETLKQVSGLGALASDSRVTRNAYHLYKISYTPEAFGGHSRAEFIQAMQAEGIPIASGYPVPLSEVPVVADNISRIMDKLGRDPIPLPDLPVCREICDSGCWLPQNLLLGEPSDMDDVVAAARKIQSAWQGVR